MPNKCVLSFVGAKKIARFGRTIGQMDGHTVLLRCDDASKEGRDDERKSLKGSYIPGEVKLFDVLDWVLTVDGTS